MTNEYVYGFDLSMSCTGISIFDLNGNIVKVCSVATNDKDTHGKRLKTIADFILALKEQYPAKTVVIERGFSRFNTSTAVIFRVHGIVNFLFWDAIQIYYPPKTVKEAILNGKATKEQVRKEIELHYPEIVFENEDQSDAFAVSLTYFMKKKMINWR
jgi:Holliday junction resolvasome RuvABC endonuclease subunit